MTASTTPADGNSAPERSGDAVPFWGGVVSVLIAWSLFAPVGMVSLYLGYLLYDRYSQHIAGLLIMGFGSIAIVLCVISALAN